MGFIVNKEYPLHLGDSIDKDVADYITMRYNFKPDSLDISQPGSITEETTDGKQDWMVEMKSTQAGELHVFRGARIPAKDVECVLVFDPITESFQLERLKETTTLQKVRKTSAEATLHLPAQTMPSLPQNTSQGLSPEKKDKQVSSSTPIPILEVLPSLELDHNSQALKAAHTSSEDTIDLVAASTIESPVEKAGMDPVVFSPKKRDSTSPLPSTKNIEHGTPTSSPAIVGNPSKVAPASFVIALPSKSLISNVDTIQTPKKELDSVEMTTPLSAHLDDQIEEVLNAPSTSSGSSSSSSSGSSSDSDSSTSSDSDESFADLEDEMNNAMTAPEPSIPTSNEESKTPQSQASGPISLSTLYQDPNDSDDSSASITSNED